MCLILLHCFDMRSAPKISRIIYLSNYTCFYTNCLTLRVRYCRHFVIAFHSIFVMLERHCRFLDFFTFFLYHFCYTLQACVMFSSNVLLGIPLLHACTPWSWSLLNASKRVTYSCLASLHISFYLYASATLRAYVIFTSPALYNFSLLSVVWAKMKAKVDGQVFTIYSFWCIRKILYIQCAYKSPKQMPFADLIIQGLSLFTAYMYTPAKKCMCIKKILIICTCIYNMCTCIYTHSLICGLYVVGGGAKVGEKFLDEQFFLMSAHRFGGK